VHTESLLAPENSADGPEFADREHALRCQQHVAEARWRPLRTPQVWCECETVPRRFRPFLTSLDGVACAAPLLFALSSPVSILMDVLIGRYSSPTPVFHSGGK
jgi:hypothetical protein